MGIPKHGAPRADHCPTSEMIQGATCQMGRLVGPMGMCRDKYDRLYVCDCSRNRVQIFTRDGDWLWSSDGLGSQCSFISPTAITIDENGFVLVASDHCVQIF